MKRMPQAALTCRVLSSELCKPLLEEANTIRLHPGMKYLNIFPSFPCFQHQPHFAPPVPADADGQVMSAWVALELALGQQGRE